MIKKEIDIFGRLHRYDYEFQMKKDIEVMQELKAQIRKPQILSYCGMETVLFFIKDDENFICSDCVYWIHEQKRLGKEEFIRDCLLRCAVEDEEWTRERNEGLTGIFYRMITFLPEVQDMVCDQLDKYLQALTKMYEDWITEERLREEAEEIEKKE